MSFSAQTSQSDLLKCRIIDVEALTLDVGAGRLRTGSPDLADKIIAQGTSLLRLLQQVKAFQARQYQIDPGQAGQQP